MKRFVFLLLFIPGALTLQAGDSERLNGLINSKYEKIDFPVKPDPDVYKKAVIGYYNLKLQGALSDKELLTIIDFSQSSNKKRIWVIDMKLDKVVYHNLVAHGKNTGNEFAKHFSNVPESNKSSLGFYVTAENYHGKHGLSLRLDGKEKGYNDNARKRAIVMHGAAYVDASFTKNYGRIGRSFGCPSIPLKGHEELLTKIAGGTCLFIYYPDKKYMNNSLLLNERAAAGYLGLQAGQ